MTNAIAEAMKEATMFSLRATATRAGAEVFNECRYAERSRSYQPYHFFSAAE